jgi:hypothetical protein
MRNLGTQHCLTSDDEKLQAKRCKLQKKREKRETNVSFRCEEVFTRQYLGSSTHIVIYNIQVLGGKKTQKETR